MTREKSESQNAPCVSHYIDGCAVGDTGGGVSPIYNPTLGCVIRYAPSGDAMLVDRAVTAAQRAFPAWSQTPPIRRARILFAYKALVETNMDRLAHIVSEEHGKTLSDAAGSIQRGLEVVEFACGIPHLLRGDFTTQVGSDVDSWSLRAPLGVCAGITPFNFPAMVPMWMFPMAIACGNCFILKPSERDPSCAVELARLFTEAGLPNGVLNVVHGGKDTVEAILHSDGIAAVSFVGSTPIAERIYHIGTANNKRVQALGGAKNHMVVMGDADLDQTCDALMGAAFGSAGERCMAISVAVAVGEQTADRLREALAPRIRGLKVGPSTDPETEMGPMITPAHLDRVRGYVDAGVAEGADLVVDGRDLSWQGYEDGFFLGGCLFDRVTEEMSIYREEIFGPVLSMVRAANFDQALNLVNQHEFGNGSAIFTRDGDAARSFTQSVQTGMVGVNVPIPVPVAYHSFGGWKRSLFGDHNTHGMEGVRFYTRVKTVTARWPTGIRSGAEFVIPNMK